MRKLNYIPCEEKEKCYGCTSCAMACPTKAIKMLPDEKGFLYPCVDEDKCTNCNLCKTVCPAMADVTSGKETHPLVFGAKNKDDEVRKKSSSGALFPALAETLFDLYDDAVIYGCAYDENIVARHERTASRDGILRFQGSKYVQSDMGIIYAQVKQDLDDGNRVLFSGTPCQISGLKAFLRRDYNTLFTLDIICTGVVSPALFKDHVRTLSEKRKRDISQYYNRSKAFGWKKHVEEICFADGSREYNSILSQTYKQIFYSHLSLRECCYQCRFCSLQRESDITIGDFWGIEEIMPEFCDDLGVSVVLVNTKKGEKLLEESSNRLNVKEVDFDSEAWKQRNLKVPTPKPANCGEFWKTYHDKGYGGVLRRYTYYSPIGYLKVAVKKMLRTYING